MGCAARHLSLCRRGTLADVAGPWINLGFTILMTVVGGALATNYRGLATKHVRLSQRWSPRLRRRPPDPASFVLIERIIGVVMVLVGTVMVPLTLIDLVVGTGR